MVLHNYANPLTVGIEITDYIRTGGYVSIPPERDLVHELAKLHLVVCRVVYNRAQNNQKAYQT